VRRAVVLGVVLALLAACGPGRLVRRGQVNEDALDVIRRNLPALRGLAFAHAVPALAMSPEEVRATLAGDLQLSYPGDDLARVQAVYTRLGLLPPGADLRVALERIYEEEGAGFYDPRSKRLILATRALHRAGLWLDLVASLTGRDPVGEFLVAHELTHALQDQHYGLPTDPEPLTNGHGDQRLARTALLEGDATLAGFSYVLRRTPDPKTIGWIEAQLHRVPAELAARYPDVPEVVRATIAFYYDAGTAFAGRALAAGGWAAVDRAQADPPESSEQILHPARYYEARERPVAFGLGGTEALEAAGWTRILEDTLGEFEVRVLSARALPAERAARVADGWGGDRLRALAQGDALVLVWMTAWDTSADAAEFAEALPAAVSDARVERRDDRVLVLLPPAGEGTVDAEALAARVWSRTTATRPAPGT